MEREMEELKKIVTGLLVSSPLQATLGILDRDYADQIGERIPFRRLGFSTLENCLRSMPDILQVVGHGPNAEIVLYVSNKSAHINDLVTKQKTNPPKRKSKFGNTKRFRPRRSTFPGRQPPTFYPTPLMSIPVTPPFRTEQVPFRFNFNHSKNDRISNNTSPPAPVVNCSTKNTTNDNTNPVPTSTNGAIPKQKNFPVLCTPEIDSDTSYDEEIYMSDTDEEIEIIDTSLKNSTTHSYSLTTNAIYNSKDSEESKLAKYDVNVPLNVQNNLKLLISKYDDGIWCSSLPEKYKEMFSKELDYVEYGYRGLINMCLELSDIFHCTRPDTGDFKLYNKQKPLPKDYDKSFQMSKILKHFNEHNNLPSTEPALIDPEQFVDKSFIYPDNVMELDDEIPRQFIPPSTKVRDFIEVSIGEIYDPSKFWVLLNDYSEKLDELMNEIQSFYNTAGSDYNIPEHMITTGMYCVANYNYEYHRAIIVNTIMSVKDKVKVYYIDYGTVSAVYSNTLKFLHRQFCDLPQQAIRARLASIYPPTTKTQWSLDASNRFLQLVLNKVLIAHIESIDDERQILEIFLADTTGATDIYMNDTLVDEGYALFTSQQQETITLEPQATPWVKHIHKYPTFIEIENSAVPSADEMARLLKTGMPLEQIYPRYFCQETTKQDELLSNEIKDMECMEHSPNTCKTEKYDKITDDGKMQNKQFQNKCFDQDNKSLVEKETSIKHEVDECVETIDSIKSLDVIQATPATRPPPGFQNILPSHSFTTTTHVTVDPIQNAIVTQTTNVNHTNHMDLLNLLLSQQNRNLPPLACNFAQVEQRKQPTVNALPQQITQSPESLMLALLQQQGINNSQTYPNVYPPFLQQLNYLNQQNSMFSNTQSNRTVPQDLIYRNLLENSQMRIKFAEFLLYHQNSPSLTSHAYLSNYVMSNLTCGTSPQCDVNYNYCLLQLLNTLTDQEIFELYELLRQLSISNRLNNTTKIQNNPISTDCLSDRFEQLNFNPSWQSANVKNVDSLWQTKEPLKMKRRLVIQAEIKHHKFHVIWYNQEAHINVEELLKFVGNNAPIQAIRREILMKDGVSTIIDLSLSSNPKLYNELSRYITVHERTILHLISASSVPKILPLLSHNFYQMDFEGFFDKISANSDLWFYS